MSAIVTEIDGVKLKLSNLEKELWVADHITKAELIQYYISVASYILPLSGGRPLSFIRYPDGIDGNRFYSKNAPDFTPDWIDLFKIDEIRYICIKQKADLVYLANLAALEIHAMTVHNSSINAPDTLIFDLDPSESVSFDTIKETCLELKQLLEHYGYCPYLKTSGGKGLHIYVPIHPAYTRAEVMQTAKDLGKIYTDKNKFTTLRIGKEPRQGKILIDIYRNHHLQTCIAPLSTRAKPGAPVSMPMDWEDLNALVSSQQYNIHNALNYLKEKQPWLDFNDNRTKIHTAKHIISIPSASGTAEKLSEYASKRNFTSTSEPSGLAQVKSQNSAKPAFVLQLHDSSNLHYDLRLEDNGVLMSWAIPKCMPVMQKSKKLAIRTEDHPLEYLTFEGNIPEREYGGGRMWIVDTGGLNIIKKDEKTIQFSLSGQHITGEFLLIHTKENQWLIEKIHGQYIGENMLKSGFMLAAQTIQIPSEKEYFFELKWDGIRIQCIKEGQKVSLLSKSGRDLTSKFPEIAQHVVQLEAENAIIDGELISPDKNGVPVFANIISRMHMSTKSNPNDINFSHPVLLYVFDLINLDGLDCRQRKIETRRDWLKAIIKPNLLVKYSESFDDGLSLFEAAKTMGLEGIMAKRRGSMYTADSRSTHWLKVKVRNLIDVFIIGYTKGKGDRSALFGALHIGQYMNEKLVYLGKVGTGYNQAMMAKIFEILKNSTTTKKPFPEPIEEESATIWIEPKQVCEVQYASLTPNGTLREPVFNRLKYADE